MTPSAGPVALNGVDSTHGVLKWAHGVFLYRVGGGQTLPVIEVLDRQGATLASLHASIPGVARVWIHDVDRTPDGSVVFSGLADGSEDGRSIPILCWLSKDGQTSRVVRTAPYWPYALAVAPGGTLWTAGLEMLNGDVHAPGLNPDSNVLRHFNSSGVLIGSALKQRDFKPDLLDHGFLGATQDRVGWYAQGNNGISHYIEISLPAMQQETHPGLPMISGATRPGVVEQFALTGAGSAFVSVEGRKPQHRETYTFDRESQAWVPLQVPPVAEQAEPHLRGSDGENLVFSGGNAATFFEASR